MSKKKNKVVKSKLTTQEKKLGKQHAYILIGMIVVGLAIAVYRLNTY